jgi:hypothetical protein
MAETAVLVDLTAVRLVRGVRSDVTIRRLAA